MDKLFGSKTRVALLAKLLMDTDKSFYLRELSRELKIPYGMVYKEEKNLVSLGIVREDKKGKVTLVSINRDLPYFAELKNLIIKTVGFGYLLRNLLSKLKGIQFALVYGSFASGEESESSDVDLLIVGNLSEEKILDVTSLVEKEVGREVNYILWSKEEFIRRVESKHHLLREIVNKPIIMLVGEEDEFRRIVKKQSNNEN